MRAERSLGKRSSILPRVVGNLFIWIAQKTERVIDLHCHILPGIDDGAPDIETSLAMARMAADDGIRVTACTPHMMPGIYDNAGPDVRTRIAALQSEIDQAGINLKLVCGADVHLQAGLGPRLKTGQLLSLADSRYFLFEPPHHVAPPRLEDVVFDVMAAGFHPILTHPERLSWIESHYDIMKSMAHKGVWMQITCGSLTGRFGRRPKYWADRMLDEGMVHLLATDAHNLRNRSPLMSEARVLVADRLGPEAAEQMVLTRPQAVLDNVVPSSLPGFYPPDVARKGGRCGIFRRLFATAR